MTIGLTKKKYLSDIPGKQKAERTIELPGTMLPSHAAYKSEPNIFLRTWKRRSAHGSKEEVGSLVANQKSKRIYLPEDVQLILSEIAIRIDMLGDTNLVEYIYM